MYVCMYVLYNVGGGKVNIADGQLGMTDFSIRIEITATINSLIQNKKKRMMTRASVAKNVNPMMQGNGNGGRNSVTSE